MRFVILFTLAARIGALRSNLCAQSELLDSNEGPNFGSVSSCRGTEETPKGCRPSNLVRLRRRRQIGP